MLMSVVTTCPEEGSMKVGKLSHEQGLFWIELIVSVLREEGL